MQFIKKVDKKWYEFWKTDMSVTLYGMELSDKEFEGHLRTYTNDLPKKKKNFSLELVLENNANVFVGEKCYNFLRERFSGFSFVFVNYKNSPL